MMTISLSPEDYVARLYQWVLRRQADPDGMGHWVRVIGDTADPMLVLQGLLASDEYRVLSLPPEPLLGAKARWDRTGGEMSVRFGDIASMARSHPAAGLPDGLDVIVPVFNAGRWLAVMCDAYDAFGISPLYIVDSASTDDSAEILRRRGARLFTAANERTWAEPMLRGIIPHFGSRWVWRIDDDELPTRNAIDWLAAMLPTIDEPVVGISLRNAAARGETLVSCASRNGVWSKVGYWRVYRPAEVKPIETIHTPGIEVRRSYRAPVDVEFIHLDWIAKSQDMRSAKVDRYVAALPDRLSEFTEQYLPERMPSDHYESKPLADDVVSEACRRLLAAMPSPPRNGDLDRGATRLDDDIVQPRPELVGLAPFSAPPGSSPVPRSGSD